MGGGALEVKAIEIPLVHVQQYMSWDCGISAVMMVLKILGCFHYNGCFIFSDKDRLYMKDNLDVVSTQEGFDKSTWTIDLAYLLHKFGINHLYTTVTIGVNPGYSKEDFYLRVLQKDAQRIKDKFSSANLNGVRVEKRSVELDEILNHLASENPVIVLVNANLLFCDACTCHAKKCLMQVLGCCNSSFSYQGHYIVICGFDKRENKILYRNPSVFNKVCNMPYDSFEVARKSFGTDEDVLFVYSS